MSYDNTNTFAVFLAKSKKSDKSPTHSGRININGIDYQLSGWEKTTRNGEWMLQGKVNPVEEKVPQPIAQPKTTETGFRKAVDKHFPAALDDDIPF